MTDLSSLLYDIGKWSGVAGFFTLGLLIFSGDTARWWDKYFGLDRIIKFQRKSSYFVAVWILLHPSLFIISSGMVGYYLIPDFSIPAFALGIVSFYIFLAVMIASKLYKLISYRAWQYIHVVTYLLFFFTTYHLLFWGSDAELLTLPTQIMVALVMIGIIYRTTYKLKSRKNSFVIEKVTPETHNSFTLHIRSKNPLKFIAGQFSFLRLDRDNLHARHPFTIASAPNEPLLRYTIKEAGRFTKIAKTLKPGTAINIDGPFGRFTPPDDKPLALIAGGVGITPHMSIIRDRLARGITQSTTLLYGNRTEQDIIYRDELEAITAPWFKKVYVLSGDAGASIPHENGYIDEALLKKYISDATSSLFYICGPEPMKNSVRKILGDLGISKDQVFIEDFFW